MDGPQWDEMYTMSDEELDRFVASLPPLDPPRRGLHHQPPVSMAPDWQARGEVIATILAHSDRGDGYCATCHEVDPCGTRLWQERVLERMGR